MPTEAPIRELISTGSMQRDLRLRTQAFPLCPRLPSGQSPTRIPKKGRDKSVASLYPDISPFYFSEIFMPLRSSANSAPICLPCMSTWTPLELFITTRFSPPASAALACPAV